MDTIKTVAVLAVIISTLFAIVRWQTRRSRAKSNGERGESAMTTLLSQMIWAVVFVSIGAFSYFSMDNLPVTSFFVTMGLTSVIWGLVALLLAPSRPQAPTRH